MTSNNHKYIWKNIQNIHKQRLKLRIFFDVTNDFVSSSSNWTMESVEYWSNKTTIKKIINMRQ